MTAAPFTEVQALRLYAGMPLELKQEFSNFATFYAVLQWFEGVHNISAVPAALPSPAWCASVDAELTATAEADAAATTALPAFAQKLAAFGALLDGDSLEQGDAS